MIKLSIVLPCFNEEGVLENSTERLTRLYNRLVEKKKISPTSFFLYVNDGSKDSTWQIICQLHKENKYVKGLCLSHNVGHQNAIMAGMMAVKGKCDAVITIDADLQDDINAIEKMVDKFYQGIDVVYGVKVSRDADSFFKRFTAQAFYKLQKAMSIESVYNHADFRLLSNRVLEALSAYHESNLYLRGIIPMIGFPSSTIDDVIGERDAGQSSYTLPRMLGLALDGITSFSAKPIYAIIYAGLIFLFISFLIGLHVFYSVLFGTVIQGWASLMVSVWFIGGMMLVGMGVVGLYIGKIYIEVKRRPRYNVQEYLE